jgi:hypothetical protein
MRAALPRMGAWLGLQRKLERFADLPTVPESWQAELTTLEQADPLHRSATIQATAEVTRLAEAICNIPVDQAALALSGRLAQLDTHVARNLTAELDLAPRRADLVRANEAIRGILVRIGREDEADSGQLLLTAAQSAALDDLTRKRSGTEAKLRAAKDELVDAADNLSEARRHLGPEAGVAVGTLTYVTAALTAFRASDHLLRLRAVGKARDQHADTLVAQLIALQPWSGDAAAGGARGRLGAAPPQPGCRDGRRFRGGLAPRRHGERCPARPRARPGQAARDRASRAGQRGRIGECAAGARIASVKLV